MGLSTEQATLTAEIVLGIVVIVSVGLGYLFYRRRKGKKVDEPEVDPESRSG